MPRYLRGFYVLYSKADVRGSRDSRVQVSYIGISGLGEKGKGIYSRLRSHNRKKRGWTHFSFFEVHDNVSGQEIRELEALLLQIFRHDTRVHLSNVQTGSRKFSALRREKVWKA